MKAMTQTRNDSGTKRPIRRKTGPRDQNTSDAAGYDVTWSLQGYNFETDFIKWTEAIV